MTLRATSMPERSSRGSGSVNPKGERGAHPVALVGHSLGGNIAVHFASLYPEWVSLLCAIEGLGLSPKARHKRDQTDRRQQLRDWVDTAIEADHRRRRYYRDIDSAAARIMAHDPLVDAPTALHMARHGLCPAHETGNNDLLRWKYDERLRAWGVADVASPQPKDLWGAIQCPVLLVYGAESWASNPDKDGRAAYFQSVRVEEIPKAGHNVHHHQKAKFLEVLDGFLH